MMDKRRYTKYKDVYAELEKFCGKSLRDGLTVLPGERELARIFQASRLTLRKAIEEAQMNGIVRREGRHTGILPDRRLKSCGKILFITPGAGNVVLLPAFERLLLMIKPQIENLGGTLEVYLDKVEAENFDRFKQAVDSSGVILLTLPTSGPLMHEQIAWLKSVQHRIPVLALSDPYLNLFDNVAALDNIAVGELAAEALARCGCSKVLVLGVIENVLLLVKRYRGFRRVFPGQFRLFPRLPREDYIIRDIRALNRACELGFDGAFVVTDEQLPLLVQPLEKKKIIPEHFKLITFHGSGDGMHCVPPLPTISHGTSEVAAGVIRFLKDVSRYGAEARMRKLVKPDIYLYNHLGGLQL